DRYLLPPDRSVPRAGSNHDAGARANIEHLLIELHLRPRLALQEVIRLRQSLVIVQAVVQRDLRHVDRAGEILDVCQPAASGATGAGHGGKRGEAAALAASLLGDDCELGSSGTELSER